MFHWFVKVSDNGEVTNQFFKCAEFDSRGNGQKNSRVGAESVTLKYHPTWVSNWTVIVIKPVIVDYINCPSKKNHVCLRTGGGRMMEEVSTSKMSTINNFRYSALGFK